MTEKPSFWNRFRMRARVPREEKGPLAQPAEEALSKAEDISAICDEILGGAMVGQRIKPEASRWVDKGIYNSCARIYANEASPLTGLLTNLNLRKKLAKINEETSDPTMKYYLLYRWIADVADFSKVLEGLMNGGQLAQDEVKQIRESLSDVDLEMLEEPYFKRAGIEKLPPEGYEGNEKRWRIPREK